MPLEADLEAEGALVLGAGLAGLFVALQAAPRPVTILSPETVGSGASSAWAQAGIAAATGPDDTPAMHAEDTIAVGAGLADPGLVEEIVAEAPARIEDLVRLGVAFDQDSSGAFHLAREAGHSRARVVGAGSDGTGRAIMAALARQARACESIRFLEGMTATDLVLADGRVAGVLAQTARDPGATPLFVRADVTVLAAGGLCGLYAITTTPPLVRGQAMGMAARSGAVIRDAEFVQFHPTAIAVDTDPAPLATEALRGCGATLVDEHGTRFMLAEHPAAELAPRDIVARAVFRTNAEGGTAYLDARSIFRADAESFPNVAAHCRAAGIDPAQDRIPIAPAAHFHIGGVSSDRRGRSSLSSLYVCGEAAATGLHGANRLGSNSLLEATVFAHRVAEELSGILPTSRKHAAEYPAVLNPQEHKATSAVDLLVTRLRSVMTDRVGVLRNGDGLRATLAAISRLEREAGSQSRAFLNMTASASLIAATALRREESRGAHHRTDFPDSADPTATPREITLAEALTMRQDAEDSMP